MVAVHSGCGYSFCSDSGFDFWRHFVFAALREKHIQKMTLKQSYHLLHARKKHYPFPGVVACFYLVIRLIIVLAVVWGYLTFALKHGTKSGRHSRCSPAAINTVKDFGFLLIQISAINDFTPKWSVILLLMVLFRFAS